VSAVTPSGPGITAAGGDATGPAPLNLQSQLVQQRGGSRQRLESLAIFVSFGVAYGLLGYWLVVHQKVVTFDSLQRLSNAYLAWHGVPPKLAAIGFSLPPLQSIVLLPFTIISSMATSLIALPISSAVFGGLTMVAFNRLLDRCDFPAVLRYPLILLIGLVPTLAFYASGGGAEMISLFLLTGAVSSLIAWFRTVDTRFLITSAIAFSFAVMADYGNIIYLLLAGAMVATVLARHGADDAEVEGSMITYMAPAFYAVALWCLINWLIVSSPFGWIDEASQATVNIAASHLPAHSASLVRAFADSLRLALNAAPLSLVIAPALIAVAVVQRNELAGWLAAFTIVAIFRPGAEAMLHSNIADLQMNLSPPQILMAVTGAAWIYQSFPDARSLIGGLLAVGLVATVVVVWHGTATYPYQNMEQAFHGAIADSGTKPQSSRGGYSVGVTQETQMADEIRAHVHASDAILTDNSQTYGVVLLSKEPRLFRTRLSSGGGGVFSADVRNPTRAIEYFLIAYRDPSDALHKAYPTAVSGNLAGLTVVFKDARYALVSVAPGTSQKNIMAAKHPKAAPLPDQIVSTVDTK
jgi:hypothetical protein